MRIFVHHYADDRPYIVSEEKFRTLVDDEIQNNIEYFTDIDGFIPNEESMSIDFCIELLNNSGDVKVWAID